MCIPVGSQAVQTGSDVIFVVVHLLTVETALCLQAAECLTELLKLRPSTLAVQTLLTDVLVGLKGFVFTEHVDSKTATQLICSQLTKAPPTNMPSLPV